MNYQESLDYLFGLGYERSVKKYGLENSIILLNALDNPHKRFIKVQIAGTNGKGSTCAFLESICISAGIKVGVNTSPHLISVTERIRVDGVEISESDFASYATQVRDAVDKLVASGRLAALPTYFEHITGIAQLVFAEAGVEVGILEAGLGGRFDATTATRAEIVAITQVDLDHTKTLGDTIEKIAAEKAAIVRPGTDVVIANQKEGALGVILEKCASTNIKPRFASDVAVRDVKPPGLAGVASREERHLLEREIVTFETPNAVYENVRLNLPGKHQVENAAVAVLLAEALVNKGFPIEPADIQKGLDAAIHKGRLEYSDGVLYDGAHNAAGARALQKYLTESIDGPITMIFGSMSGKNLSEISGILFPLAENLILTTPQNERAMEAGEIAGFAAKVVPSDRLFVIDETAKAVKRARELNNDGIIVVTGSLYLIGEVKAHLLGKEKNR